MTEPKEDNFSLLQICADVDLTGIGTDMVLAIKQLLPTIKFYYKNVGSGSEKRHYLTTEINRTQLLALHSAPFNLVTATINQVALLRNVVCLANPTVFNYTGAICVTPLSSIGLASKLDLSQLAIGQLFDIAWDSTINQSEAVSPNNSISVYEKNTINDVAGNSGSLFIILEYMLYNITTKVFE